MKWIWLGLSMLTFCNVQSEKNPDSRWVDHNDKFFNDRVLFIIKTQGSDTRYIAPGVLIRHDLVLTSLLPFYLDIQETSNRDLYKVSISDERNIKHNVKDKYSEYKIVCARPVVPREEEDNKHPNSLHDLFVLRIHDQLLLTHPQFGPSEKVYELGWFEMYRTDLASSYNQLVGDEDIKFASLGYLDRIHMRYYNTLFSHTFRTTDVVDCNSWIPRQIALGIFICIRNVAHFEGIGSGALLYYQDLLFGIGNFLFRRANQSILVFTDIRPYNYHTYHTCTYEDQMGNRINTTTTTSTTTTTEPSNVPT